MYKLKTNFNRYNIHAFEKPAKPSTASPVVTYTKPVTPIQKNQEPMATPEPPPAAATVPDTPPPAPLPEAVEPTPPKPTAAPEALAPPEAESPVAAAPADVATPAEPPKRVDTPAAPKKQSRESVGAVYWPQEALGKSESEEEDDDSDSDYQDDGELETNPRPVKKLRNTREIYAKFIAPDLIKKHPQFLNVPYTEMIKRYPEYIDFAKIASIERERDKQFEKELKEWEEAYPEAAKRELQERYKRNVKINDNRRKRRRILSGKYPRPHGNTIQDAYVPQPTAPPPKIVYAAPTAIPTLNLPIFETANTIKPPVLAQQVAPKDSKLHQLSMAVEFMVKDENHKKYLLYLLAANEVTNQVNAPIRVHAFMGAAYYLCEEKLYGYLKAIDEKI